MSLSIIKKSSKDEHSLKFEKHRTKKERHEKGQFFTHEEIVDFILDNVPLKKDFSYLDPSCGAGAFLQKLVARGIPQKNIWGIDIDAEPLKFCKNNIKISKTKLFKGNTLKKSPVEKNSFDVIVGNPPFKTISKKSDLYDHNSFLFRNVLRGSVNLATLMVAKSLDLLKDGGYLGFVLPKNFLRVKSFSKLRNFILDNCRIIKIYDIDHHFKDVRGDQIIIILKKEKLSATELNNHKVKISIHKKGINFGKGDNYELKQKEFYDYQFYPIFYDKKIYYMAKKLLTINKNISDFSDTIFRGLTINPSDDLISENKGENKIKIFRGDSIAPFAIKYPLYANLKKISNINKQKTKKLLRKKIVIQNIFSKEGGIYSTFSNEKELNISTVTNIVPINEEDVYFYLGIMNSEIANFFMIFVMYLVSNFTMHTDEEYIGKIPVPNVSKKDKYQVSIIVKDILKLRDKKGKEFSKLYKKLNTYLFKIYSMTKKDEKIIIEALNEVMSKKRRRNLYG